MDCSSSNNHMCLYMEICTETIAGMHSCPLPECHQNNQKECGMLHIIIPVIPVPVNSYIPCKLKAGYKLGNAWTS